MGEESSERRRDLRAPVSIMGTVEGPHGELPIVLLNLSASGAMIQTDAEPPTDAICTLRFSVLKQPYELRFQVLHWLRLGEAYGWRGPFVDVTPEQGEAIKRAVHATMGLAGSSLRPWGEVSAEAEHDPDAKLLVGTTPAGTEVHVLGRDVIEMGAEGLELYARLMCELETI